MLNRKRFPALRSRQPSLLPLEIGAETCEGFHRGHTDGVLVVVTIAVVLPYTPLGSVLGSIPLPLSLLGAIAVLAVTYLLVVQTVKSWFYRRHALL